MVPYWLAAGLRLFGEESCCSKLWLLPFVWLLAWSVRCAACAASLRDTNLLPLDRAFAGRLAHREPDARYSRLALGPRRRGGVRFGGRSCFLVGSPSPPGLLAALAMQTKYTMLLIPPVIGWYGISHRAIRFAAVAIATAMLASRAGEGMLVEKYGRSHFRYHASAQQAELAPGESRLAALVAEKIDLLTGLLGDFGCLGRRGIDGGGCSCPFHDDGFGLARGCGWLASSLSPWLRIDGPLPSFAPTGRCSAGCSSRRSVDAPSSYLCESATDLPSVLMPTRFSSLAGSRWNWPAYFALTPFPAARRVIGLVVVGGILAARAASRIGRRFPGRRAAGWVIALAIAAGVIVTAIDTSRRLPREVLRRASPAADERPAGRLNGLVCGALGIPVLLRASGNAADCAGRIRPRAGGLPCAADPSRSAWLRSSAHRPNPDPTPVNVATPIAEVVWDDWLSARNHPELLRRCQPGRGPRTPATAHDDLPDLGRSGSRTALTPIGSTGAQVIFPFVLPDDLSGRVHLDHLPTRPLVQETDERVAVDEALAGTGIGAIVLPDLLAGLEIVFGYLVCLADQHLIVSGHSHRLLVIDIAERVGLAGRLQLGIEPDRRGFWLAVLVTIRVSPLGRR